MIRKLLGALSVIAMLGMLSPRVQAHCQVPCGIFGDEGRFELMLEHVTTIEKSMNEIIKLEELEKPNANQLVRWVVNKDVHADELTEIVTYYFLAQRIKPVDPDNKKAYKAYQKKLEVLHHIMVYAMKAKQSTDKEHIDQLRSKIEELRVLYFAK